MFEVLIREAGARFGLGDKALPLVQMLLAEMTDKQKGGLPGFLEKFKAAGCGPIIQSWLGGGPAAQPIGNSQIENVLGASGGLLAALTTRLDASRDHITSALGYLLPPIVGKLTPGGSMPSQLPAEVTQLAAAGQILLAAEPVGAAGSGAGGTQWLPWVVAAAVALLGLTYCAKQRSAEPAPGAAPAATAPAAPAPAASEVAPAETPTTAPEAAASGAASEAASATVPATVPATASAPAAADTAAAAASAAAAAAADDPAGAAVLAWTDAQGRPALKVFFDSGKTDVPGEFAARASDVLSQLQAQAGWQAVISGYNDPTGNAAANAELSKNRAQAVRQALIALGLDEGRIVLEKPTDTTGAASSLAAARRVEVVLRPAP